MKDDEVKSSVSVINHLDHVIVIISYSQVPLKLFFNISILHTHKSVLMHILKILVTTLVIRLLTRNHDIVIFFSVIFTNP